jgi:hypothetical protein
MSRPINIDRVQAVLLADGWHHVFPQTFDVGPYEFVQLTDDATSSLYDGGRGFGFSEETGSVEIHRYTGPIASLLAVRYTRQSDEGA